MVTPDDRQTVGADRNRWPVAPDVAGAVDRGGVCGRGGSRVVAVGDLEVGVVDVVVGDHGRPSTPMVLTEVIPPPCPRVDGREHGAGTGDVGAVSDLEVGVGQSG